MACGAKLLSEPMTIDCQSNPWEQTSIKFQPRYNGFHSKKLLLQCRLQNGNHHLSVLTHTSSLSYHVFQYDRYFYHKTDVRLSMVY